ncbi:CotH protein [Ruminiclostridium hungatei]|uniref:CotH protein n=1 Tax=Ruminiclostridium hungatei TaxID=48256 RepID=A0A1V4SNP9_RUMHU|nr:CotH kinase family protein [Ruminiclostridium hungatei]OPX44871.1 CotH protein [Ruminiclostridium hungatei]
MITGKKINVFIMSMLVVAVIFTGLIVLIPKTPGEGVQPAQPEYAGNVFNKDRITEIDIKVDETQWQKMLDSAQEEYISCDLTINGSTISTVGIRPKGNSSLATVARSDSDRFSFKFEFDHYIDGQTFMGLDKMVINNVQSDATYMKDYLSYDLMTYIGVKTPLFVYADVMVNGKDWGLYVAVEAIEEAFAQRNYGSDYGRLYKPESMEMGAGMGAGGGRNGGNDGNWGARQAPPGINNAAPNNAGPNNGGNSTSNRNSSTSKGQFRQQNGGGVGMGGFGGNGPSGGTDLKYTDDSISSYSNIFDNEVFKGSKDDYSRVIAAIKNLNSGTQLDKYIDVDSTLRYLAASTVLVNMDSYFSGMKHNYYLYEEDGKLTMLPWDYNLAFGGFQMNSAEAAVNLPIDTPVSGIKMSERPMVAKLLEVDEYREKYHEYLKQIVDEYFQSGKFQQTIDKVDLLISESVKNDATAFYTQEQYAKAVQTLKEFGRLRALSIAGQLDGSIPSTSETQKDASDKLIDTASINLSTMGSQGGGGMGGGRGQPGNQLSANSPAGEQQNEMQSPPGENGTQDDFQPPDGMQLPDGMQPPDGFEPPDGAGPPGNMQVLERPGEDNQGRNGMAVGSNLAILAGSVVFLVAGLIFAVRFKRNKYF